MPRQVGSEIERSRTLHACETMVMFAIFVPTIEQLVASDLANLYRVSGEKNSKSLTFSVLLCEIS